MRIVDLIVGGGTLSLVALVTDRALALSNAAILGAVLRRDYNITVSGEDNEGRRVTSPPALLTFAREDLDGPRELLTVSLSSMGVTSEVITTPYCLILHESQLRSQR